MAPYQKITFDEMTKLHPKDNGILKIDGKLSLYSNESNDRGYEDKIQSENGNYILHYEKARYRNGKLNHRDNALLENAWQTGQVVDQFLWYISKRDCRNYGKWRFVDKIGDHYVLQQI